MPRFASPRARPRGDGDLSSDADVRRQRRDPDEYSQFIKAERPLSLNQQRLSFRLNTSCSSFVNRLRLLRGAAAVGIVTVRQFVAPKRPAPIA